jgi:Family of unknown function (DUF6494)
MNEDVFNMSVRKFLKQVGVTSQREIESAVRQAIATGRLKGKGSVKARMTLKLEGLEVDHTVEAKIELG